MIALQEYLTGDETIDIVLWEFNLNDPDSDNYGKGLEKFVRSVLAYPSHPALIFTKFFLKTEFPFRTHEGNIVCPMDTSATSKVRQNNIILYTTYQARIKQFLRAGDMM